MRLSPVLVVATLLLFGPGLGSALGASEPGQSSQAPVSEPAHDAAAHAQSAPAKEHDHAAMLAAQAAAKPSEAAAPSEIDLLVKRMQAARGQAKIAIMADLITKLVAERGGAGTGQGAAAGGAGAGGGMSGGHGASGGGHTMSCPMCAAHMKTDGQK